MNPRIVAAARQVDADLAPTTYGRDLAVSLERGDITQMSFAFEPIAWKREVIEEDGEERSLITLTEVRLYDVAAVTYPAYEDTDAGLRAGAFGELARAAGIEDVDALLRQYAEDGAIDLAPLRNDPAAGNDHGEDGERSDDTDVEERDDPAGTSTGSDQAAELRRRTLAARHKATATTINPV